MMGREHWVETSIGSIVQNRKGKKPNTLLPEKKEGYLPYILIDELEGNIPRNYANALNLPIASKEDVLLVWDGSIGKCSSGIKGIIGSTLVALTPLGEIPTKFLEYIIINANRYIKDTSTGTGLQHINKNFLNEYVTPLPPLNEQKRIVEKLDAILPRVKSAKARLEKIPAILKKFRQSVLSAACSGRLTEDWRENNSVSFYGNDILSAIKDFRIKEYESKCNLCETQKKRKPKRPILSIETELSNYSELPLTWLVCHIGDIGDVSNGATPSRPIKKYWNGDIPWVSSGLVQNNRIKETEEFITRDGFENSSVKLLPKGTVLLAMIGEGKTRGQSSILDIDATINQNIAGIVINHGYVISEYLQLWFLLNYIKNREVGSGTGPQALNCDRVRELAGC